ncbi:hypothetical protein GCM10012286_68020 [Streptomyces lasiicapitis]|uniref:Uncharacterized protein n=1 Tax=Streptomyces lasiicapitis TaxID=1923961 RepID=A0ABQ2MN00_9ACTN|nr:hypothetical protein GCM10012286_68020 [Streptomyces lasiicapitis]
MTRRWEVVKWHRGRGESGVLWFMTGPFPRRTGPLTAVTVLSTKPDNPALKYGRSRAENGWFGVSAGGAGVRRGACGDGCRPLDALLWAADTVVILGAMFGMDAT